MRAVRQVGHIARAVITAIRLAVNVRLRTDAAAGSARIFKAQATAVRAVRQAGHIARAVITAIRLAVSVPKRTDAATGSARIFKA